MFKSSLWRWSGFFHLAVAIVIALGVSAAETVVRPKLFLMLAGLSTLFMVVQVWRRGHDRYWAEIDIAWLLVTGATLAVAAAVVFPKDQKPKGDQAMFRLQHIGAQIDHGCRNLLTMAAPTNKMDHTETRNLLTLCLALKNSEEFAFYLPQDLRPMQAVADQILGKDPVKRAEALARSRLILVPSTFEVSFGEESMQVKSQACKSAMDNNIPLEPLDRVRGAFGFVRAIARAHLDITKTFNPIDAEALERHKLTADIAYLCGLNESLLGKDIFATATELTYWEHWLVDIAFLGALMLPMRIGKSVNDWLNKPKVVVVEPPAPRAPPATPPPTPVPAPKPKLGPRRVLALSPPKKKRR